MNIYLVQTSEGQLSAYSTRQKAIDWLKYQFELRNINIDHLITQEVINGKGLMYRDNGYHREHENITIQFGDRWIAVIEMELR